MKGAQDLIPWTVTDISVYPYGPEFWSMNPSIHVDKDGTWRCVTRIVDYCMEGGVTRRSKKAGPGHQTKNAMVILDPVTWKPIKIYKMHERDDHPRASSPNAGYEDMRIFRTAKGGLQGIAASLHLKRGNKGRTEGSSQNQPPEQVLLSFDAEYNIVEARPIRGDGWSSTPQKNWVPFDDCAEPRFLYSIGNGRLFDSRGPVHGDAAVVRSSVDARPLPSNLPSAKTAVAPEPGPAPVDRERQEREVHARREQEDRPRQRRPDSRVHIQSRGTEVKMVRGGRIVVDTAASRPSSQRVPAPTRAGNRSGALFGGNESARMLGTGRVLPPKYEGLRGGTQLVPVAEGSWLGIGHEMTFVGGKKFYWHTWFSTDARGKMTAVSVPMKLAPEGIEFAAGLAIDGERVVVSFGVDDMNCRIAETKLGAVLEILRSVER